MRVYKWWLSDMDGMKRVRLPELEEGGWGLGVYIHSGMDLSCWNESSFPFIE